MLRTPSLRPSLVHQHRLYLGASELRQMRRSSGSPLLAAALEALPEPLALWTADDLGVDEQGMYERVLTDDLCPCVERSPGAGTS